MLSYKRGEFMFIVSSSGKNTILGEIVKRRDNFFILEHSSATTRAPRESDKNFNVYKYMTVEEFEQAIKEGKFFEYEIVHGNYYGTILEKLKMAIQHKENVYFRDIDVKGNLKLREMFKQTGIISIFLDAPDDVLRQRLIARGDKPEDIERRLSRGQLERSYKPYYDLVIENIDMEKTINMILDFIDKKCNIDK